MPLNLDTLFAGTPIFVTEVMPRKTGEGILGLEFIAAFNAVAPIKRKIEARVIERGGSYLVGAVAEQGSNECVALIGTIEFEWLDRFCAPYRRIFPTERVLPYEKTPTTGQYLGQALGQTERDILSGATSASFNIELHAMPKNTVRIELAADYSLFDSFLIRRGFVPSDMAEKWFIYFEDRCLNFYRSWTGYLIYQVYFEQQGELLHASYALANRDPAQYGGKDIEEDKRWIAFLIDEFLLGKVSPLPS